MKKSKALGFEKENRMKIKKFTTYEFDVGYTVPAEDPENMGYDEKKEVSYKVNEDDDRLSVVSFELDGRKVILPANLIKEIGKAMQEVNPFEFALGE